MTTRYGYDEAGRLTLLSQMAANGSGGSVQSFSYNPAGQVTGQAQAADQYVWSGHRRGRRTSRTTS